MSTSRDLDAPGFRDEPTVAADAVWALMEAGLLPKNAETVKKAAKAAGLSVDDLRLASFRKPAKPRVKVVVSGADWPDVATVEVVHSETEESKALERAAVFERRVVGVIERGTPVPVGVSRLLSEMDDQGMQDAVAWLARRAGHLIEQEIRTRQFAGRARSNSLARHRAPARAFGEMAAQFELGNLSALTDYSAAYVVDGEVKELGDMTGSDHEAVAGGFQKMGSTSLMLAAIHRQIAKRVGDGTTREIFDQEEYVTLFTHRPELGPPPDALTA